MEAAYYTKKRGGKAYVPQFGRDKKEQIASFILCLLIGTSLAALMGFTYSTTIPITALLVLYVDRGWVGSLTYCVRRVQAQVCLGGACLLMILGLRAVWHTMPDWFGMVAVPAVALLIFMPVHYCYTLAPATVTLGTAVLIMSAGILKSPVYFGQRILQCAVGGLVGCVVKFLLMPKHDRFAIVSGAVKENGRMLFAQLAGGEKNDAVYKKNTDKIAAHYKFIIADNKSKRFHRDENEVALLGKLNDLNQKLSVVAKKPEWASEQQIQLLENAAEVHRTLIDRFLDGNNLPVELLPSVEMSASGTQEIHWVSNLLTYREEMNHAVSLYNVLSASASGEPGEMPMETARV